MAEDTEQPWRLPDTVKGRDVHLGGSGYAPLTASAKARLHRIVHRAPEVMVKVTGRSRGGGGHLKAHLDYITRNGKIPAHAQDGRIIVGRAALRALNDDWLLANAAESRGRSAANAAQSVSLILSMPPGTSPDRLEQAALAWARETFGTRYDWIMARHDDTDHPHVHVSVRAVGPDGRRLAPGPQELQQWRERFARELRKLGIEAEATPRQARGKVRKTSSTAILKALERGVQPKVLMLVREQAEREAQAPTETKPHTWSRAIQLRQENIRRAYLVRADALEIGTPDERQLATDIRLFVADMPVPLTHRQALLVELRRTLAQHSGKEPQQPSPDSRQSTSQSADLEIRHRQQQISNPYR